MNKMITFEAMLAMKGGRVLSVKTGSVRSEEHEEEILVENMEENARRRMILRALQLLLKEKSLHTRSDS